jgi:hypothetical protein
MFVIFPHAAVDQEAKHSEKAIRDSEHQINALIVRGPNIILLDRRTAVLALFRSGSGLDRRLSGWAGMNRHRLRPGKGKDDTKNRNPLRHEISLRIHYSQLRVASGDSNSSDPTGQRAGESIPPEQARLRRKGLHRLRYNR